MMKLTFARLFQGLLLLASAYSGCTALAGQRLPLSRREIHIAWRNSSINRLTGLSRALRNIKPTGNDAGAVGAVTATDELAATAVASSTSHLVTGRSASGVLENCIEACVNTLGSFVGGTITGCVIGAFMGGTFGKVPDVGLLKSVRTKAGQMGGDWGKLTATFTGFTSLSTVIRGRNDQWDQVVGAAAAGAFLNRAKGPSGMMQGAATYGLFSLIFAGQSKQDPMDVVDVPVDAPMKK